MMPEAGFLRGRQRLFAEDELAGGNRRQDVFFMRRPPGCYNDRVDVAVVDQRHAIGIGLGANRTCHPLGLFLVDVANRNNPVARQNLGQAADMILPDHARADDADLHRHCLAP